MLLCMYKEVEYLGHKITPEGIKVCEDKVEAVKKKKIDHYLIRRSVTYANSSASVVFIADSFISTDRLLNP